MVVVWLASGIISALITAGVRHYAVRHAVLDIPNERSSHTVPTPRGGGLGIVLATTSAFAAGAYVGWLDWEVFLALVGGGSVVAGIGLADDHRPIPAAVRLAVHFGAALWAVHLLGGVPELRVGNSVLALGPLGWVAGALGIVWLINLYNFMDGIDGIAAAEAASVGAFAALLAGFTGHVGIAFASAVIAAAAAAFLIWNWSPARIFMGDVGSGFLGYTLIVLALASERQAGPPLLVWLILLGVFVLDATVTLVRRVARGEPWAAPHRRHAYQRAVQSGMTHGRVSAYVLIINAGLGMVALAAVRMPASTWILTGAAVTGLVAIYLAVERQLPMGASDADGSAQR